MENAIEFFLSVKELLSQDRNAAAISLIEEEKGNFGPEFISFITLIAEGESRYIQLSFFNNREEYMYAPCGQDSKESLVMKSVLTGMIYHQGSVSESSLEAIANRARAFLILGHDSASAIEKVFFYGVSSSLFLLCMDFKMNVLSSMFLIRHFLIDIEDDKKWLIASILRDISKDILFSISKIDFTDYQFNDVLNSLIGDIFGQLGIKETIFTIAEYAFANLSFDKRRDEALSILSNLKSKNIGTVWGENIIRALVYMSDKSDEDFDRGAYYKALCDSVLSEEFLFPHLLFLDYCIETQSAEDVYILVSKMIENPVIPTSVKAYLKAFLGEFMNRDDLLSAGVKDALDIFCKGNSSIAMYVLSAFSEHVI